MNPILVSATAFKTCIRPENLRIRSNRQVRVNLDLSSDKINDLLVDIGEVWVKTFSNGAIIQRQFKSGIIQKVVKRHHGLLELPDLLYDLNQWQITSAVKQTNADGDQSLYIEIQSMGRLSHQIQLTPKSDSAAFLKVIVDCQTSGGWAAPVEIPAGLLEFVERRWRRCMERPDISRPIDCNVIPEFIQQHVGIARPIRITVLNAAVKQTGETCFASCRLMGNQVILEHPELIVSWDHTRVAEAWMVRCGCSCGEEVLEMYDARKRLIASIAFSDITSTEARLLSALN